MYYANSDTQELKSDFEIKPASTFLIVAVTSSPGRRLVRFQPCVVSAQAWLVGGVTEKRTTRPSFFTSSTREVTY